MNRFMVVAALTVIAACVGASIYYILPQPIDIQAEGVYFRLGDSEPTLTETRSVRLSGVIKRNLIGAQRFVGTLDAEGIEQPATEEARKLDQPLHRNSFTVVYFYYEHGMARVDAVGAVMFSEDRSKIAVQVFEKDEHGENRKGWSGEDGLTIVAPASSREEAVQVYESIWQEIREKYYPAESN